MIQLELHFFFDSLDLTTSYGYYGPLSFPLRPPSPFSDGLLWPQMSNTRADDDDESNEMFIWSPSTKQLTVQYSTNTNNNNNNNSSSCHSYSPMLSETERPWKRIWNRLVKRTSVKKGSLVFDSFATFTPLLLSDTAESPQTLPYDFGVGDDPTDSRPQDKHVHWMDDEEAILNCCCVFVEHLKLFVQHVIDDSYDDTHWRHCQWALTDLHTISDCSELQEAFDTTLALASKGEKIQLLRQQTLIAHLISRMILSS